MTWGCAVPTCVLYGLNVWPASAPKPLMRVSLIAVVLQADAGLRLNDMAKHKTGARSSQVHALCALNCCRHRAYELGMPFFFIN